jgi:hypothetical protein
VYRALFLEHINTSTVHEKTKKNRKDGTIVKMDIFEVEPKKLSDLFGEGWWAIPSWVDKTRLKRNGTFSGVDDVKISFSYVLGGKLHLEMRCELRNMYGSLQ